MPCSSACSNMAENLRYQRKCYHFWCFGFGYTWKKTYKKACFFVLAWRHRTQPPSQAGFGFGFGLESGSPVWFWRSLRRRGIKLRQHQGPTGGGVIFGHFCSNPFPRQDGPPEGKFHLESGLNHRDEATHGGGDFKSTTAPAHCAEIKSEWWGCPERRRRTPGHRN